MCRAWDEAMNTQPDSFTWNLMGMLNNCHYRVKVLHLLSRSRWCRPLRQSNYIVLPERPGSVSDSLRVTGSTGST